MLSTVFVNQIRKIAHIIITRQVEAEKEGERERERENRGRQEGFMCVYEREKRLFCWQQMTDSTSILLELELAVSVTSLSDKKMVKKKKG